MKEREVIETEFGVYVDGRATSVYDCRTIDEALAALDYLSKGSPKLKSIVIKKRIHIIEATIVYKKEV